MEIEGQEKKEEVQEAIQSNPDKKIIRLKYSIPIKVKDGQAIQTNQIEVGRIKVKHLKNLPKGFMDGKGGISPKDMILFISGLTELPIETIEEIDVDDLSTVTTELESFLENSFPQQTGKK